MFRIHYEEALLYETQTLFQQHMLKCITVQSTNTVLLELFTNTHSTLRFQNIFL
jgi:hypothetical protein